MSKVRVVPSVCVLVAWASSVSGADPGVLRLRAVDAWTGEAVVAGATVAPARAGRPLNLRLTSAETATALGPERYRVTVAAPGYRPLSAEFDMAAGLDGPVTFELDPFVAPDEVRRAARRPRKESDVLFHGFVTDVGTARPLPGVRVKLLPLGTQSVTDTRGYFRVLAPAAAPVEERLPLGSLVFQAPGYRTHEVSGIALQAGDTLFRESLTSGDGRTTRDDTPKVMKPSELLVSSQSAVHPPDEIEAAARMEPMLPVVMDPPDTIRVGTSCSCTSCSAVSVMSLETYVRRGLNDEWISSWNAHSLRSGAVAYRSYGSYYVAHPLRSNYDICSNTCCQVNDSDTSTSTSQATDRTAGYLLERGGSVFRAEYSAENNSWDDPSDGLSCVNVDLSCGDGFAGSPAASWPCLSDLQDAGHGCFGHGRGACQWGTQRWASTQGKMWKWIVDHYYNADGGGSGLRTAQVTTPVILQPITPSTTEVGPGQSFTLSGGATNTAEVAHSRILVGASLYSASTGYLNDPANDVLVTLAPGANMVSRSFAVPASTPNGIFDLLVSLYDDVDENGAIGGNDFVVQIDTRPAAMRVCGPLTPSIGGRTRIPVGLQVRLQATSGFAAYRWFQDGSSIPGATSADLVTPPLSAPSTFRVDVADGSGCAGSTQATVAVVPPTFADVASDHAFYAYVEALARDGVTQGCGGGNYCPGSAVNRGQVAAFLLRAKEGGSYAPPACTDPTFADVPCTHMFAAWIYELARRGITTGCGGGNYCPSSPVTRGQVAPLLLRTLLGGNASPPACTNPTFADVPCAHPFADWIYDLAARGITGGCGGGNYCPAQPVTRGQMAPFLVRTFDISLVW